MSYKSYKAFRYYPVAVTQAYTGKDVMGFKFPAGDVFIDTNPADLENLQQFQLYFGINEVISSLEDIQRTGTDKTNKIYSILINQLKEDYDEVCKTCLKLASGMCWVPTYDNKASAKGAYDHKLTPERAIYEIEPAVRGLLLAVQTKMDLTFPTQLVKNIARLDIEKELIDFKEDVGEVKRITSKK